MILLLLSPALAQDPLPEFSYAPVGELVDGSGDGRDDALIYVPELRFPLEAGPAYANSQVWGRGGLNGGSGGQCHEENYSYPWRDNYCETRGWRMPLCPAGTGHQGQDIRPASCEADTHWAVAADSGTIARIGSFSVTLVSDDGTQHRYLHLEPKSLTVEAGERVSAGQRIGRVSNAFFNGEGERVPTTTHLHYDINMNLDGRSVYVPTYTSLVRAFERLLDQPSAECEAIPAAGRDVDDDEACTWWFGPPRYWRVESGLGEGGSLHWTNAFDGEQPGNWARYMLNMEAEGRYILEVNAVAPRNASKQVRYLVRHSGEETEVILDQSPGGFLSLGTFAFAEGGDQWVSLYDNTGEDGDNLHISADVLRVRPAPPEPPPPEEATPEAPAPEAPAPAPAADAPAPTPESRGCGCSGLPGGPHGAWLGLLGLLLLRRRR